MIALFWVLGGLVLYAYVGYPLLIWALSLLAGRRRQPDDAHRPTVSLLIPAYNEERIIAEKIDNALAQEYPAEKLEIIVASESTDRTDEVVAGYAGRGVKLVSSSVRRGKVANLQRAVPGASGEILIFTDANAIFRLDAIRKLVRHFADPRVGSVSGRLIYRSAGSATPATEEGTYWSFEMMVKRASSRLGSLPGANGSLFALRRGLYMPMSERRGDDFELPIRVILQGYDSILEPEAVTEETASTRYLDEYRRKVRIINWMVVSALMLLGEAVSKGRWLIAFQLLSHKITRWAVPFWLLGLLPVSIYLAPLGRVYLTAAVAQVLFYLLAGAGLLACGLSLRLPRILGLPLYFVVVNAACLVGILASAVGHEVTWHKRPDEVI